MKALIDVTHPAHVHFFRHPIEELTRRGHDVRVTSRRKDVTCELLDAFGIDHTPISTKPDGKPGLAAEWMARELRFFRVARSFDPDVVASVLSPAATHAGALLGARSVVFNDSEESHFAARITEPFADAVATPAGFDRDLGAKGVRYDGFHELAYLHPARFEPDRAALVDRGVPVDEPYFVVRFVAWGAHHDVAQAGLSPSAKRELVDSLSDRGTVYVTSEGPLPPEFERYRIPVEPHLMHDLLAYADLYVGDSQTMATEAAVLGVPAVRTNSFAGEGDMSNFLELREYGLLDSIPDEAEALDRALELADDPETGPRWRRRRERFLEDKVDVTDVVVRLLLGASDADSGGPSSDRSGKGVPAGTGLETADDHPHGGSPDEEGSA